MAEAAIRRETGKSPYVIFNVRIGEQKNRLFLVTGDA